jgi:hypothetical protein
MVFRRKNYMGYNAVNPLQKDITMSLKNIIDQNHNNVTNEYGKLGIAGLVLFGWALMGSLVYTVISIIKKIRK